MGGIFSTPEEENVSPFIQENLPCIKNRENPRRVVCRLEDLEGVDIIVNSTDKSLKLSSGGQISKAILRIAGQGIQDEINEEYPNGIDPGEIAVTGGHNLNYEYVYHCSLQNMHERISHHEIREVIRNCLEKAAEELNSPSIAFPAIGTGCMNFPPTILRTIYCTILEFIIEHPGSLGNVFIIIHPSKTDLIDCINKLDLDEQTERLTYPVAIPSSWSQMNDIKRIKMSENDDDYQFVKRKFNKTINRSVHIIRIERIENKRLFVAYERFKDNLPNGKSTEKYLWHGTGEESIDGISRYGFDWRLTKRAIWGQGCYFASMAKYSDQDMFAIPNNQNEKFMFCTSVVAGDVCIGNNSITEGNISCNIQSTVNDLNNPTIYVTYDDDQQYPAYVVVYK